MTISAAHTILRWIEIRLRSFNFTFICRGVGSVSTLLS